MKSYYQNLMINWELYYSLSFPFDSLEIIITPPFCTHTRIASCIWVFAMAESPVTDAIATPTCTNWASRGEVDNMLRSVWMCSQGRFGDIYADHLCLFTMLTGVAPRAYITSRKQASHFRKVCGLITKSSHSLGVRYLFFSPFQDTQSIFWVFYQVLHVDIFAVHVRQAFFAWSPIASHSSMKTALAMRECRRLYAAQEFQVRKYWISHIILLSCNSPVL